MTSRRSPSVVIIGIGNPMRRDDGVGPAAVAHLAQATTAHPDDEPELITLDGEPARLLEAWRGRRRAIVIDAARFGREAGSIHRLEVGSDPLPPGITGGSSHTAGLAEAVALGRQLELLPDELIVFGVEPGELSLGEGLSSEVQAALPALVEQVAIEAGR